MPSLSGTISSKHLPFQRGVAFFFLGLILAALIGAQRSLVAHALARGEKVPVLFFGVDAADASRHTDTLMLGVFDPVRNYLSMVSIPRDTRIDLPGYRFNRVNEIYGYNLRKSKDVGFASGKVLEGIAYLISSEVYRPALPNYIQVDFSGFNRMIDLVGGVWVEVKLPMHYDDNAGNYHFHKEPGRYLMDGDESLRYVRYRGPTGDRGRIFRQQEFVRSFLRRLANPMMVLRVPEFAALVRSAISTNMSLWDLIYLGATARRLRSNDIGFYVLPGQVSGMYWSPKKNMVQQLVSLLFLGKMTEDPFFETIAPQANRITVKVWNASGRNGMGYTMTKFLRTSGYDVLDWANYATQQLQTRVIDRTGRIENAQLVAGSIGVENFHSEPNPKALVDVDVVIGQNYVGVPVSK